MKGIKDKKSSSDIMKDATKFLKGKERISITKTGFTKVIKEAVKKKR